jgi:hypothetical protein
LSFLDQKAIGQRKIFISLVLLVAGIATVALKGDVPANFLTLMQTLVGAFVAGNGIEHLSKALTKPGATELAATGPDTQTKEAIAELAKGIQAANQGTAFLVQYVQAAATGKKE